MMYNTHFTSNHESKNFPIFPFSHLSIMCTRHQCIVYAETCATILGASAMLIVPLTLCIQFMFKYEQTALRIVLLITANTTIGMWLLLALVIHKRGVNGGTWICTCALLAFSSVESLYAIIALIEQINASFRAPFDQMGGSVWIPFIILWQAAVIDGIVNACLALRTEEFRRAKPACHVLARMQSVLRNPKRPQFAPAPIVIPTPPPRRSILLHSDEPNSIAIVIGEVDDCESIAI